MPFGNQNPFRHTQVLPMPSHKTDTGRIVAKQGNPDWWNQFVEPQLETLQQQPVARIGKLFNDYLGDPSDPANMNIAAGWLAPAARRALAEKKSVEMALAAGKARLPQRKKAYIEMMQGIEKNPHVASHVANFEVNPVNYGTLGSMNMNLPTSAKKLKETRIKGFDEEAALKEMEKSYGSSLEGYRRYLAGDAMPDHLKHPDDWMAGSTPMTGYWQRNPEEYKKAVEQYNNSVQVYKGLNKRGYDLVNKELAKYKPTPQGNVVLHEQEIPPGANPANIANLGETYPGTVRHELGHVALKLKDDPSSQLYDESRKQFGYWLNPNEIRARAIQSKGSPVTPTRGNPFIQSYPKNDYMKRITKSIEKGMRESDATQRADWFKAFQSGDVLLPPKYYDYVKNIEPADYLKIQSWANPPNIPGVIFLGG